jgi:hypothetical protein
MPNPTLYVIPETHTNKQDQERSSALVDLASWGAINVLLESVLFHDTSGQSVNLYGIEEEASIKRANLFLHHVKRVKNIQNFSQKIQAANPQLPAELLSAQVETRNELKTLKQTNIVPKPGTRQELKQFIANFPITSESDILEKHIFYKRNHKMANNIQSIVQTVLVNTNNPRVFALSIGAKHIDSSTLAPTLHYQGKKDLPTILGNSIVAGTQTVDVLYGNQSVATIAEKALELSDNLSWSKKWPAQVRLKLYVGFGI